MLSALVLMLNLSAMDDKRGMFKSNMNSSHNMFSSSNTTTECSGSLMRYHSAPHSVLSGLLDDDFGKEDAEFEKMLDDGIGSFSSLLDIKPIDKLVSDSIMTENKEEDAYLSQNSQNAQYAPPTGNIFQEQLPQTPLSVIRENVVEEPLDKYSNPHLPLSSDTQSNLRNQINATSTNSTLLFDPQVNSLSRTNSGLRRLSSSPAAILSRIAAEEAAAIAAGASDRSPKPPKSGGDLSGQENISLHSTHGMQSIGSSQGFQSSVQQQLTGSSSGPFTDVKRAGRSSGLPPPSRPNLLLRQSSSPAGLLSELAFEEMGLSSPGSPGYLQRSGWGSSALDLGDQAFGLRKRGRGLDERSLMNNVPSPKNFGMASASNFDMDGSSMDPFLIKARAKRGCATHPRSIAERVRRTKISERIKKLQDLVPNLDKQSSTAEMLDEVVEYVKQLQRQVQELSMKQPHCTGKCQQARSTH